MLRRIRPGRSGGSVHWADHGACGSAGAAGRPDRWQPGGLDRARSPPPAVAGRLLDEALALWRGEAYAEWGPDSWAGAEIARLGELRLLARELAMRFRLAAGEAHEVGLAAEALVHEHPLREEGWRLLALALWATGRQGDALAALRRAASVCAEELGLDLGPGLVELERAILAQDLGVLSAAVPAGPRTVSPGVVAVGRTEAVIPPGAGGGVPPETVP
ncbi:BTAD domain-containing putative transcriptional regulator [Streptomyces racemochromogenes]|uniref:BTAD domain-containing putative transcriptional regulator n=1 Tax=Streptomyces racemochromogenes TaxID=67353 RepID=A0ABW7PDR0_9ACTN